MVALEPAETGGSCGFACATTAFCAIVFSGVRGIRVPASSWRASVQLAAMRSVSRCASATIEIAGIYGLLQNRNST